MVLSRQETGPESFDDVCHMTRERERERESKIERESEAAERERWINKDPLTNLKE